ncbi:MAG: hypothetical protein CM1200mP39_07380 [Dehalococcoidia bacterium]|nr:MAG: hypothetical protein CM1200mP39_07380 [Dehalococcoidia bacterium]
MYVYPRAHHIVHISILSGTSYSAFKYREYRLFWVAAAFSNIGMWSLVYGRLFLMRTLTGSEVMLGLVATANLAPVLIFSMWGGVLADRFNRLKIVRFTRLMFAVATFGTGILIQSGAVEPWHILVISSVTGTLLAFDIPSRSAMVASIVPKDHLGGAIALYSIVFGAAAIIGPILIEPLVSNWGLEGLFYIIGGSYVLTVITLFMMQTKGHKVTATTRTALAGLIEGFAYLKQQRSIFSVILLGITLGVFGTSFDTLLPVFTDEIFQGGLGVYGQLLLGVGIGGLIATIAITLIGNRIRPALYLTVGGDWPWRCPNCLCTNQCFRFSGCYRRCDWWIQSLNGNNEYHRRTNPGRRRIPRTRSKYQSTNLGSFCTRRFIDGLSGTEIRRSVRYDTRWFYSNYRNAYM